MAAPRLLAAATLSAALVLVPVSAGAADFRPGASGSGEKYFPGMGNGGYDVTHYGIKLGYDPGTLLLTGRVKVTARATHDLSRFNLDLRGLQVRSVTVDGKAAKFRRAGAQELVITPAKGIPNGKKFTVVVVYDGKPAQINDDPLGTSGWVATRDGAVALNQPFGAATWFPVNDTPKDKAAYDFTITVPKGLTAIANGDFLGRKTAKGKSVYRWRMKQPMASELSMVAIGKYKVLRTNTGGLPSYTAIDSELAGAGQLKKYDKKTRSVVRWLSSRFGAYPFTSTGGVVDEVNVGYSLETQGRPVHDWNLKGKNPPDGLIVHELAHQWFGDSVTPAKWKDIWLNEGFATYAEWMWSEKSGGATAAELFRLAYSAGPNADVWKGVLAEPGRDHIFDNFIYQRGAMTVHRLRVALGDKVFFGMLKSWLANREGGTVSTKGFQAFAEKYSGKQLDGLFDKWVYKAGKPKL
ncbi:M1 family metallopeptidase [Actinocorallia sp. A-T 12471]|uniref:M1 family metallopeptidase n=1 Tax=Actinocorallia sp. A-T 12471 TaxID=3089813 RepID=UPI0029D05393|nr:M1 family metallopeptidase [Actinocorallia sp. A-T 12471]MDX6738562.1 M1 family metallopeptidase [Actinocorallia sp. A-T 12471]